MTGSVDESLRVEIVTPNRPRFGETLLVQYAERFRIWGLFVVVSVLSSMTPYVGVSPQSAYI